MEKVYEGLALFGKVCRTRSDCGVCKIFQEKGALTCQEFIEKFPDKAYSLLKEMDSETYTYYDELMSRFPENSLNVEIVSESFCRKAIFDGDSTCTDTNCLECWKEKYNRYPEEDE